MLGIRGDLHTDSPLLHLAGLGFGGQIGYWGLYVDGQCDGGGMSRDCSTYKRSTLRNVHRRHRFCLFAETAIMVVPCTTTP